ncbi:hypothetical protein EDEG_01697 [Edhazardia aedis USNM 41457]|uniref:Uncharacterized protein n=1 Tax=Edhazardia aedis (strain USNM 41457) TaxID=1003232 RepID=J9D936_EDHAE|nr:hypothetical protein EDEG_01697 [Edhazardia aedis USNM 41457]|eukprot:EJW04014.1 hypothetical protein EDEG_01697 [Edhazardia aedis USNM 41457]
MRFLLFFVLEMSGAKDELDKKSLDNTAIKEPENRLQTCSCERCIIYRHVNRDFSLPCISLEYNMMSITEPETTNETSDFRNIEKSVNNSDVTNVSASRKCIAHGVNCKISNCNGFQTEKAEKIPAEPQDYSKTQNESPQQIPSFHHQHSIKFSHVMSPDIHWPRFTISPSTNQSIFPEFHRNEDFTKETNAYYSDLYSFSPYKPFFTAQNIPPSPDLTSYTWSQFHKRVPVKKVWNYQDSLISQSLLNTYAQNNASVSRNNQNIIINSQDYGNVGSNNTSSTSKFVVEPDKFRSSNIYFENFCNEREHPVSSTLNSDYSENSDTTHPRYLDSGSSYVIKKYCGLGSNNQPTEDNKCDDSEFNLNENRSSDEIEDFEVVVDDRLAESQINIETTSKSQPVAEITGSKTEKTEKTSFFDLTNRNPEKLNKTENQTQNTFEIDNKKINISEKPETIDSREKSPKNSFDVHFSVSSFANKHVIDKSKNTDNQSKLDNIFNIDQINKQQNFVHVTSETESLKNFSKPIQDGISPNKNTICEDKSKEVIQKTSELCSKTTEASKISDNCLQANHNPTKLTESGSYINFLPETMAVTDQIEIEVSKNFKIDHKNIYLTEKSRSENEPTESDQFVNEDFQEQSNNDLVKELNNKSKTIQKLNDNKQNISAANGKPKIHRNIIKRHFKPIKICLLNYQNKKKRIEDNKKNFEHIIKKPSISRASIQNIQIKEQPKEKKQKNIESESEDLCSNKRLKLDCIANINTHNDDKMIQKNQYCSIEQSKQITFSNLRYTCTNMFIIWTDKISAHHPLCFWNKYTEIKSEFDKNDNKAITLLNFMKKFNKDAKQKCLTCCKKQKFQSYALIIKFWKDFLSLKCRQNKSFLCLMAGMEVVCDEKYFDNDKNVFEKIEPNDKHKIINICDFFQFSFVLGHISEKNYIGKNISEFTGIDLFIIQKEFLVYFNNIFSIFFKEEAANKILKIIRNEESIILKTGNLSDINPNLIFPNLRNPQTRLKHLYIEKNLNSFCDLKTKIFNIRNRILFFMLLDNDHFYNSMVCALEDITQCENVFLKEKLEEIGKNLDKHKGLAKYLQKDFLEKIEKICESIVYDSQTFFINELPILREFYKKPHIESYFKRINYAYSFNYNCVYIVDILKEFGLIRTMLARIYFTRIIMMIKSLPLQNS